MYARIIVTVSCIFFLVGASVSAHHEENYALAMPENTLVSAQAKTNAEIAADIRASQKILAELGYYRGSVTGKESTALTKAVKAYQKDNKLKTTGKANGILVRSLEAALKKAEVHIKRVKVVEQMLHKLDYSPGRVDGKEDASLSKAIKAFQKDRNSKAKKKGEVNGTVIRSLRIAMEAKGLTPPKAAYSLSSADGSKSSTSSKKKTSKSKTSAKSKTEKSDGCKKGTEKVGSKCLKVCKTGYKRDKKSNRCKKSSSNSSTTKAKSDDCKSGTEKVGSKCLKVCKTDYKRDSKTNRCKKSSSSTSKSKAKTKTTTKTKTCKKGTEKVGSKCLKICKSGYKRDKKTNRCKKK